jgi:hypothetical protein
MDQFIAARVAEARAIVTDPNSPTTLVALAWRVLLMHGVRHAGG